MIETTLHCILCDKEYHFSTMRDGVFEMTNNCRVCQVYFGQEWPTLKIHWVHYEYEGNTKDYYLHIDYRQNFTELMVYRPGSVHGYTVLTLPSTFPLMPAPEAHKLIDRLKNLKAFL